LCMDGTRKAVKKTCRWHVFRPWESPLKQGLQLTNCKLVVILNKLPKIMPSIAGTTYLLKQTYDLFDFLETFGIIQCAIPKNIFDL